jgi:arsenic resistance protein ArsH
VYISSFRVLGRWMRMFTIQKPVIGPDAFDEFDEAGRVRASSYFDGIGDVIQEFVRFTVLLRPHARQLGDVYPEMLTRNLLSDRLNCRC